MFLPSEDEDHSDKGAVNRENESPRPNNSLLSICYGEPIAYIEDQEAVEVLEVWYFKRTSHFGKFGN